jgi:hypothetical protein
MQILLAASRVVPYMDRIDDNVVSSTQSRRDADIHASSTEMKANAGGSYRHVPSPWRRQAFQTTSLRRKSET